MSNGSIKESVLPWVVYPAVLSFGIMLHLSLLDKQISLMMSTYLPVISAALLITLLELYIPYRREWRPKSDEVGTDLLYMLLVQIIVPKLLTIAVALSLLVYIQQSSIAFDGLWMHDWPVGLQVVLMMASAELIRYWVHRLAHTWSPLWRLHAVHHSTDKLYWLNTGRFHPLEKAIQFLVDSLPFILLGVSADVLALYFVCYAINGFFQHSNINLKFGLLNYVISTAELHRWHHAKDIKESGSNYGNNLIIWDLLFGSWFLPKNRQVGELGLFNRRYPMKFIRQLQTPFTPGIDKKDIALLERDKFVTNLLTRLGVLLARIFYYWPFLYSLRKPMQAQGAVLKKIIRVNSQTHYGQQHGFSNIHSIEQFKQSVPIQGYESLRPYIEQQASEQQPALTQAQPFYYAQTSGTTGTPKYIPVVHETLQQHKRSLAIFACVQSHAQRHCFSGDLLAIPGPYDEGQLTSGTTYGSISGLLYRAMPTYLRKKYVIPESVFSIKDHELKYRVMLRLALQCKNITYLVSANPSTFLKLNAVLQEEMAQLAEDIASGTFSALQQLPEDIGNDVAVKLVADESRAKELQQYIHHGDVVSLGSVWPNLRLVATWTAGSCGITVESLKKMLPSSTRIIELGYLASELRGAITLTGDTDCGVPTLHDNFYEFIEVADYENGSRDTLLLNQLKSAKKYYIIVTTPAGLYRYFMNDIVEVAGFQASTPCIRFVQKGKGVTSITGEKLSEQQLISAVEAMRHTLEIESDFYLALAYIEQARYELYLEPANGSVCDAQHMGKIVDQRLQELNVEYAGKRQSGRLNPLTVQILKPGTKQVFEAHCLNKGQRESQFKILLIQYRADCDFPFEQHCISD